VERWEEQVTFDCSGNPKPFPNRKHWWKFLPETKTSIWVWKLQLENTLVL